MVVAPCDRHSRSWAPTRRRRPDRRVNRNRTSRRTPTSPTRPPKAAKAPEVAVTVQGTVTKGTDDKGRPTYSVTADGKTWELSAGPSWYWGDKNPLNAYVGQVGLDRGKHARR